MTANLVMVGDIFPGNAKYNEGLGVAARFFPHRGTFWEKKLAPFFEDADIAFANLEAPLVEDSEYAVAHTFAGCREFARFLANIGINIVSVANNHILEQEEEGFHHTLQFLEDAWVCWVGTQVGGMSNIKFFQCKGIRIGFAAFNAIHDIFNPGLVADLQENDVLDCIRKMKISGTDIKVISLHWGNEFVTIPSGAQIRFAHKLIDAGADVIVGHHPHVVQPVERYRHGLIFYSLGNFIFDILWTRSVRTGVLANVEVTPDGVAGYELVPVYLGDDFMPVRLEGPLLKTFWARQGKNIALIESLSLKNENGRKYESYYRRVWKWNRFLHRLAMKWYLAKNWHKLSLSARKEFGANLAKKLWRSRG